MYCMLLQSWLKTDQNRPILYKVNGAMFEQVLFFSLENFLNEVFQISSLKQKLIEIAFLKGEMKLTLLYFSIINFYSVQVK